MKPFIPKVFVRPFIIGTLALGLVLPSATVFAQTQSSIAISPLTFEITANPGDVITNTVRIYNGGSDPLAILMHVEDFSATGETGQAIIETAESTGYSIASWTSVDAQETVVAPGVAGLVNFTIRVPFSAEPGGHYGAITAEARGAGVAGGGTAIAQKVAALLLVSVAGNARESLTLTDFSTPGNLILSAGAITLTSRFENQGTVHLKPRGFVTITDMFGREVAQVALDQRNVLPGTKRLVETTWQPEGLAIGRMHANLTAIYGSANEPLTASVQFWIIPLNVVGPVLGGIAIVLLLGFVLRKRLAPAFSILVRGQRT